ncbi:MAG: hypothetical protein ACE5FF_08165 [Saprospiraceae bacterium]
MKKLLFPLFALICILMASSCASDSCSIAGKWKVKSADIQSEKLTPTILQMAKDELLNTQYEFTEDGQISINTGGAGMNMTGTYTFDAAAQTLTWDTKTTTGADSHLANTVTACSHSEITLTQRQPEDPAKEAVAITTFTLERIQ